jgi:hypothetical protein
MIAICSLIFIKPLTRCSNCEILGGKNSGLGEPPMATEISGQPFHPMIVRKWGTPQKMMEFSSSFGRTLLIIFSWWTYAKSTITQVLQILIHNSIKKTPKFSSLKQMAAI